jgi:hypothetical protein
VPSCTKTLMFVASSSVVDSSEEDARLQDLVSHGCLDYLTVGPKSIPMIRPNVAARPAALTHTSSARHVLR